MRHRRVLIGLSIVVALAMTLPTFAVLGGAPVASTRDSQGNTELTHYNYIKYGGQTSKTFHSLNSYNISMTANTSIFGLGGVGPFDSASSGNWAGYVAVSSHYDEQPEVTAVQGTWIVQQVITSFFGGPAAAQWIGIGGFPINGNNNNIDKTLIQTGTVSTENYLFQRSYKAWYELLPSGPVYLSSVTVHPGNVIDASIQEVGTNYWEISITDATDGQSSTTYHSYDSSMLSADWIEEWPFGTSALADFGTASFGPYYVSNGIYNLATINGQQYSIGETRYWSVTMASGTTTMAYPNALAPSNVPIPNASYDSFQVTWVNGN